MKKGRNSGGKDEEGGDIWQQVTRSIKAYTGAEVPQPKLPVPQSKRPVKISPPAPAPVKTIPPKPAGFDRATETKLKRGQLALEGRLDLHGMTQAEAFAALHRFILSAVAQQKRTVLVITGKGGRSGLNINSGAGTAPRSEGILKKMLPLWLEDPALGKYIIGVTPAQPKDGGSGAFYLRLRKDKS